MGNFHRFTDPTYSLFSGESFPATPGGTGTIGGHTYDRVNVTSGGFGAGGSALADGQKVSGVNEHTYFVAFGDEATSLNVNRGLRAAFESLDVVDDALRSNLPKLGVQSGAAPSATGIMITGTVFCGHSPSQPVAELVAAVQQTTLNPLYNALTPLVPTDIDNGTPGSSVIGNGWVVNPTVRFNASVVQAYTLYYGQRTSYARVAETEQGVFWAADILSIGRGLGSREALTHGLNERYRRATVLGSASPALNTPGSGSRVTRDGAAVTIELPVLDWASTSMPDTLLAGVRAEFPAYSSGAFAARRGGDVGFLALPSYRAVASHADELSAAGPMRAAVASYVPRSLGSATIDGTTYTRLPAGAAATLNPSGAGADVVALTAPNYFKASAQSAMYSGDLLVVNFGGGVVKHFLVDLDPGGALPDTQVKLKYPTGESPAFSADTAVTVSWYSSYVTLGGTTAGALEYYAPKPVGSSNTLSNLPGGLKLHGWRNSVGGQELLTVLESGDLDQRKKRLALDTTGSLISQEASIATNPTPEDVRGYVHHTFVDRTILLTLVATSSPHTIYIEPSGMLEDPLTAMGAGYSCIIARLTGVNSSPQVINIVGNANQVPGAVVNLYIENVGSTPGLGAVTTRQPTTLSWTSNVFRFSDASDAQITTPIGSRRVVTHFRMRFLPLSGLSSAWFVERVASYVI